MKNARIIKAQLGREPRGVLKVERRCRYGYPKVIKVYPLLMKNRGGTPETKASFEIFPTLFWLTCPTIVAQISQLEHQGCIKELERIIAEDRDFRRNYHQDHRRYVEERWQILKDEDKHFLKERGLAYVLKKKGIGGIADWDKVKCLQLHYAHYLARDNIIGRLLDEQFTIRECHFTDVICDNLGTEEL